MSKSTILKRALSITLKRTLSITLAITLVSTLCLTIPILKESVTKSNNNSAYAADSTISWIKNYGGSGADSFLSVVSATGGGYVAVGCSASTNGDLPPFISTKTGTNFVIAKFDSNGNKQWLKNYGGTGSDYFYSVTGATGGGYIAVGYSSSSNGDLPGNTGTKTGTKFVIAKFDNDGNKQWIKTYGGTGADYFQSVSRATGGGYIAAGYSSSSNGDLPGNTGTKTGTKFVIAKFDNDGNKQWVKTYGGTGTDYFYSITQAPDGGYVAAGHSTSSNGDLPSDTNTRRGLKFVIAKVDNDGNKQWLKAYGGTGNDYFQSIICAPTGGYIAAGYSSSSNGDLSDNMGNSDAVVAKFDNAGNKIWFNSFGGSGADYLYDITQAPGKCFVVSGNSASSNGDMSENYGGQDIIIAKFNKNGKKIWLNNYGGSKSEYCNSIIQGSGGGHIAAGSSFSADGDLPENKGNDDFVLCKIIERFTITLDTNGGNKIALGEKTVVSGGKYGSLPSPKKKGYKFVGWYTKKKNGKKITKNSVVAITKDRTLYARWKAKKYTIQFHDQKGKQLYKKGKKLIKKVTYGKKYGTLQKPKDKTGKYQFLGWYTKKVGGKKITAKSIVKITKNTKLYTRWKKKI